MLPHDDRNPFQQNPWKLFRNTTAGTIPPFSVLRITGAEDFNGAIRITVAQPNATQYDAYMVNGPYAVAAGEDGICTTLTQAGYLAYDSGDGTPALGESWGAKSGQWTAAKNVDGFFVCGGVITSAGVNAVAAIQISAGGGDTVEVVEVRHSATTDGLIVAANASGYHPGRIRTPNGTTTYDVGADIWIQFAEGHDGNPDDDGDIVAVQGEYYGPAKLFGTVDIGGDERPLYVCICDERSFIAVNSASPIAKDATGTVGLLHSTTFGASGISKAGVALQHIPANAIVKITRRAGVWMIELLENPLVRFELTGTLALSGDAAAVLLDDDGADWTNSATAIQVYDLHTTEGMWAGISGYRGWALRIEGAHASGRPRYGIVWMEQIAQTIEFTATEYMGATTANQLTGSTVTWYDHQGKDPGSTVTVRDPNGRFPDVHSGAKGTAVYDYHNGYYRIVSCQRVALFAAASLTADSCGSTMSIDGFTVRPTGDYVGAPPTTPTAPSNTCGHAGLDNDVVLLRRTTNTLPNPSWEVVDITKHSKTVMTDVQVTGLTLQKKEITIYTEVCTTTAPSWATWHTGDDCTP